MSARLLITGEFSVVSVNRDVLGRVEIGDTIGVAADTLPTPDRLDGATARVFLPEATDYGWANAWPRHRRIRCGRYP